MNRHSVVWHTLVLFLLLAFLVAACNPPTGSTTTTSGGGSSTRTEGDNELKRWQSTVYKGPSSSASLPIFNGSGWHPLASGDAVSTDADGEAELNLAGCYPGHIYVFVHSTYNFGAFSCRQSQETSSSCLNGALYADSCLAEYSVDTGSARITVSGTSFGAAYLPEAREMTLVVVMEDTVQVEPWIDSQRGLDPAIPVPASHFLFTLPGTAPPAIAGLDPRVAHPVSDLPALLSAVDPQYQAWVLRMAERASEREQLPPEWPRELGGSGSDTPTPEPGNTGVDAIEVVMAGGPLAEPRVQEAIVRGVEWPALFAQTGLPDMRIVTTIGNESVDLRARPFEPDLARQILDEMGYPPRGDDVGFMERFSLQLLFPEDAEMLAVAAEFLAAYLHDLNIAAEIQQVPAAELERIVAVRQNAGEAVLVLRPRR